MIEAVTAIHDGLDLPSRRDLDGTATEGSRNAAALTHEDAFMDIGPEGSTPPSGESRHVSEKRLDRRVRQVGAFVVDEVTGVGDGLQLVVREVLV